MLFAEIAVNTYQDPTKRLFTYKVPEELVEKVEEGTRVLVPFGKRSVEGYIFELKRVRPSFPTREIKAVKGPTLTPSQVKLARWLSNYYAAPPLDCLKCQLPGKGERYTEGKDNEIKTLLLIPYAAQVKLKALELPSSERKTTLVGSRSAVFAPLPNLEKIVIEEPENWTYKDERSPYYHAKDVAEKRAELEGLKLELKYLVPRVEDISVPPRKTPRGNTSPIPSPPRWEFSTPRRCLLGEVEELARLRNQRIEIIDLKKERDAGNFSPLSSEVVETFKQSKRTGPPATLKPTRHADTSHAGWRSFCGLAYVISRGAKEEVEKAIRAEGLDVNRIEIAGAEIFTRVGKAFDTAVLIDADTLLNLPDFRAHEKLLLTIAKLSQLTKEGVIIQTANPAYPIFEELRTGNLKNFYQRELKERKPLLYPPFGVLAKLEFSAKTTAKVNFEAEKLYEALTHDSRLATHNVFISPPYSPYTKSRGKAQLNIAVRAKTPLRPHSAKASRGSEGQARRALGRILAHVPPTWRIIVDPESLL